jgi:hypothetical protein
VCCCLLLTNQFSAHVLHGLLSCMYRASHHRCSPHHHCHVIITVNILPRPPTSMVHNEHIMNDMALPHHSMMMKTADDDNRQRTTETTQRTTMNDHDEQQRDNRQPRPRHMTPSHEHDPNAQQQHTQRHTMHGRR